MLLLDKWLCILSRTCFVGSKSFSDCQNWLKILTSLSVHDLVRTKIWYHNKEYEFCLIVVKLIAQGIVKNSNPAFSTSDVMHANKAFLASMSSHKN